MAMGGNYDSSATSLVTMTPCQTSASYRALQVASDSDEQSFSTTTDGFGARHTYIVPRHPCLHQAGMAHVAVVVVDTHPSQTTSTTGRHGPRPDVGTHDGYKSTPSATADRRVQ